MIYLPFLCTVFLEVHWVTWAFHSHAVLVIKYFFGLCVVSNLCLYFLLNALWLQHTRFGLWFILSFYCFCMWCEDQAWICSFSCVCPVVQHCHQGLLLFLSGKLCFWTSVPLVCFFNCLGYCGFTKSFEMRKSVLSNVVVLQGCFGLRQYKILKFQNHFVSFWKKKKGCWGSQKGHAVPVCQLRDLGHYFSGLSLLC